MSEQTHLAGLVILCDKQGDILKFIRNSLNPPVDPGKIQSFVDLVDPFSLEKATRFLKTIHDEQAAFDWEVNISREHATETLSFTGVMVGEEMVIAGDSSNKAVYDFYAGMSVMNNEQSNLVRRLFKRINQDHAADQSSDHGIYNELMHLNNELVNLQRQLTKKNQKLNELIEQKNHFLGMAAHDLRNPLGVIQKYSEFLMHELSDQLNPEWQEFISTIHASSEFMLTVVEDFLDISRLESGKIALKLQPTDIVSVTQKIVQVNRVFADRKTIALDLCCDENMPELMLDRHKIEQVLNNLLSNAIKYSLPNTKTSVRIGADKSSGNLVISVRDQGQGIPEQELDKLFAPYGTTSVRSTAGEKSTGLGLAIVKKIVEAHGGHIQVETEVGEGSTFVVSLPLQTPPATSEPTAKTDSSGDSPALGALQVLVVDDDPDNCRLSHLLLRKIGLKSTVVQDGEAALTAVTQENFDLILMDIEMPRMNGLEAASKIKQKEALSGKHIPIIMMSAHSQPQHTSEFRKADVDGFIAKPMKLDQLKRTIQEVMTSGISTDAGC